MDDDLLAEFGRIWPRHVSSLMKFLIECRRHFDGDMDLFLVLCVIGDRTFSERDVPEGMDYTAWNAATSDDLRSGEINVQSIANYSGIPRETVRRKLGVLIDKGWVVRDERGYITATDKAKRDLEPLTLYSLTYLSRMKSLLGSG